MERELLCRWTMTPIGDYGEYHRAAIPGYVIEVTNKDTRNTGYPGFVATVNGMFVWPNRDVRAWYQIDTAKNACYDRIREDIQQKRAELNRLDVSEAGLHELQTPRAKR